MSRCWLLRSTIANYLNKKMMVLAENDNSDDIFYTIEINSYKIGCTESNKREPTTLNW